MSAKALSKPWTVRDITHIAVFAALIAVCSWISIPTAIPFTLQTLGVFLAVGMLGGRRGTAAVVVYLLLGAAGLPVFAGFTGGLGILFGYTGGYFLGFLFSALLMWGLERLRGPDLRTLAAGMLLSLPACYACGLGWSLFIYDPAGTTLRAAFGIYVLPYIVPDLGKMAAALVLTARLRRYVK